jgi:hypothetical protein
LYIRQTVKRFFKDFFVFLRGYFLGFLAGLAGASGFLAGRPLLGTTFIASKSSSVYKASCEKGFRPALSRRRFMVSLGRFSFFAISEIVIPFIPHIIGSIHKILKNITYKEHLLNIRIGKRRKNIKNVPKKGNYMLTLCSF